MIFGDNIRFGIIELLLETRKKIEPNTIFLEERNNKTEEVGKSVKKPIVNTHLDKNHLAIHQNHCTQYNHQNQSLSKLKSNLI